MALRVCVLLATLEMEHPVMVHCVYAPKNYVIQLYQSLLHSFTLTDIDECGVGLHDCSKNAACINTIGSFLCECLPRDGVTCEGQYISTDSYIFPSIINTPTYLIYRY